MLVVLISGFARHGKDTFATFLKEELDLKYKVQILRFGDRLKEEALLAGWNGKKDIEGRQFIQEFGEAKKKEDKFYWANRLYEQVHNPEILLIPDWRVKEELEFFKDYHQIYTVRINRENEDDTPFENDLTPEQRKHRSEVNLLDFDFDTQFFANNLIALESCAKIFAEFLEGVINDEGH